MMSHIECWNLSQRDLIANSSFAPSPCKACKSSPRRLRCHQQIHRTTLNHFLLISHILISQSRYIRSNYRSFDFIALNHPTRLLHLFLASILFMSIKKTFEPRTALNEGESNFAALSAHIAQQESIKLYWRRFHKFSASRLKFSGGGFDCSEVFFPPRAQPQAKKMCERREKSLELN